MVQACNNPPGCWCGLHVHALDVCARELMSLLEKMPIYISGNLISNFPHNLWIAFEVETHAL